MNSTPFTASLDPFADDLEPVGKLVRELPGRPHPSTGTRMTRQGLPHVRIGRRLFTTRDALRAFLEQRRLAALARRDAAADFLDVVAEDADLEGVEAACTAAGI
ncbi:MAG: hypothetical protein AAFY08_11955 [Planctomycetota bacterium]